MNPIVFAMRRPLTVMVLVVAVALGSLLAVTRMSIDIFPNLNLPVVYVAQPYGGMDPAQMEGLLTNYYEYHFLYISGIHHVESRNVQGMAVMKLFFHPGTNMAQAMAETIGYVTRARAFMPPGTVSPFVTRFDAGSVPVGYLVLSSETKSIGEIQDQALFKVRPMFASLQGVSAPPPFGGNQRTVVVRADPERLRSYSISPDELITALTNGNTISPSGNVRIGKMMPIVPINSLVRDVKELETIPIRVGANPSVYIRDVATVQDATDIPAGYAMVNGRRAVYILVTKRADASTLSVVRNVKEALPKMQAVLPDDIKVSFEFDQSPTVTNAVRSLATEGVLGAVLTGLMVLVFLRDWRSVIVVVLNIPFAICGALVALWLTGQTINLMTLGGLALAIGILVDEATVEIENIHHKMEGTRSIASAVRQGNLDTAVPRLLAMLCILAVFLPSFFMQGAAQALFVPLSLAVGFAMVSSYLLSSTFVPVLSTWLLRNHPLPDGNRSANPVREDDRRLRPGSLSCRPLAVGGPAGLSGFGRGRRHRRRTKPGSGDLPQGGRGAVSAPDARTHRNADRGDREAGARRAQDNPERCGGGRRGDLHRLHRAHPVELPDQRHFPVDGRAGGSGAPGRPQGGDDRRGRKPQGAAPHHPRREDARGAVLVRTGRHRQRGHELRLADPRGVHGQRPQPRGEPGVRRESPCGVGRRFRRSATSNSSRRLTTRP